MAVPSFAERLTRPFGILSSAIGGRVGRGAWNTARVPDHAPSVDTARRHRVLVRVLIVLASVLLIFSILANWVQRAMLDTHQVEQTTDEILADEEVQAALSEFTVDQLYANVDVQEQLQ